MRSPTLLILSILLILSKTIPDKTGYEIHLGKTEPRQRCADMVDVDLGFMRMVKCLSS